jgi:hypothetical protein
MKLNIDKMFNQHHQNFNLTSLGWMLINGARTWSLFQREEYCNIITVYKR